MRFQADGAIIFWYALDAWLNKARLEAGIHHRAHGHICGPADAGAALHLR